MDPKLNNTESSSSVIAKDVGPIMKPMESESNFKEGIVISKFQPDSMINKFSFMCFGIGMLMPWNAMLANMAFYIDIYPNY